MRTRKYGDEGGGDRATVPPYPDHLLPKSWLPYSLQSSYIRVKGTPCRLQMAISRQPRTSHAASLFGRIALQDFASVGTRRHRTGRTGKEVWRQLWLGQEDSTAAVAVWAGGTPAAVSTWSGESGIASAGTGRGSHPAEERRIRSTNQCGRAGAAEVCGRGRLDPAADAAAGRTPIGERAS